MTGQEPAGRRDWLLALLACTAFGVVGARWLWLFRRDGPLDIDEAGYQTIAVLNYRALAESGTLGWVDSVLAPSIQAPLMTAATTPVYMVFGVGTLVALAVPLFLGVLTLVSSFALGNAVGGRRAAWLCLALVGASPLVITYSRSYNFAIAAAATTALTLWALAQSRNFDSLRWSVVAGVFLGLMALSRTMTLAFVPGLVIAATLVVVVGPDRGRRLAHILAGVLAALVVSGPWYSRNGAAVWDYLFSFGYGSRSDEYGAQESVLSATSWLRSLQYALQSEGLLTLGVLGIGLLALGAQLLHSEGPLRARGSRWGASLLMPSAVFVAWGVLILTSTGNKGTGFLAPLVPPVAVLAAVGLSRLRGHASAVVAALTGAVMLVNATASADLRTPVADPRVLTLPVAGPAVITDGRGAIQSYLADGMKAPGQGALPMPLSQERRWSRAVGDVRRRLHAGARTTVTGFGFRHRLLNPNTVQVEQVTAGADPLAMTMITPEQAADEAGIVAWLGPDGVPGSVCTLLVAPGLSFEIAPVVDQRLVRRAARTAGFASTKEEWRLPDGRGVKIWRRSSC